MVNPYVEIATYEGDDFQNLLEKMLLIDKFLPVLNEYPDPSIAKGVIKYIVYAYSIHSEKVMLNSDWHKNKQRIYEECMLPPEKKYYEDLVHLQNDAVVKSIRKWIDFQDDETYADLCMLKDLKVQMRISATADIRNAAMEINYEQKRKNATHCLELSEDIENTQSKLIQNTPKLKTSIDSFNKVSKATNTFGPQNFAK